MGQRRKGFREAVELREVRVKRKGLYLGEKTGSGVKTVALWEKMSRERLWTPESS